MTRSYKTYEDINPELFRSIILGNTGQAPVQRQSGIMAPSTIPQQRPDGLGPRFVDTSGALEESLLGIVAENLGRNAIDRTRVADAVVPLASPREIDLSEWENMRPFPRPTQVDGTREALGVAPVRPTGGLDEFDMSPPLASITGARQDQTRSALGEATAGAQPVTETSSMSALLDFISSGEGTYNSYNSGTIDNVIQHSSHNYTYNDTPLSEMTIGQIRERMATTDATDPNRIFAAGRYQVIPETFESAVESLGLSDDTTFNQETQDRIGVYLLSEKRPLVGRYIEGGDVSTERAMLDLAMEFASFPVPYAISQGTYGQYPLRDIQAGESFYSPEESRPGTNRASHTVEETRTLLESIRGERVSSAPETSPVPQPRPVVNVPEEQIQQAETSTEVTTAVAENMPSEARLNPAQYIFDQGYMGLDENNPAHQATIQGFMTRAAGDWLAPTPAHATTRAWCAAFVDDVLVNLGAPRADEFAAISDAGAVQRVRAREYMNYGSAVDGISNAQPGDIVVIRPPNSSQWHVGFFTGMDSEGRALVLGGNQSNAVNVTPYSTNSIRGVRRIENVAELDPDTLKEITTGFSLGAADGSTR